MKKIITILAAVAVLLPNHATAAAPTLDVPNTTYDAPFLIDTGPGGGNRVVVIRCDSSNGSYQETFGLFHGVLDMPGGFDTPPWPAPGELRAVETTDTGMLCVAAVGTIKGNGFFQQRASDCFYVTVNAPLPESGEPCFI